MKYWFLPLLKRAELPRIRFHDLRHTAATLLLGQGVNVKVISEMLGHADVSITLRVYAHVLPHMQQQAAEAMDTMFVPRDTTSTRGFRDIHVVAQDSDPDFTTLGSEFLGKSSG
jgi:hypothetical protein